MPKGLSTETFGLVLALNGVLITFVSPFAAGRLAGADPGKVSAWAAAFVGIGFGVNALVATGAGYAAGVADLPVTEQNAEPRALRRSYLEAVERFLADVRKTCASAGVDYLLMNTSEPLDAVLGGYLAFRQKIRRTARH